MFIKILLFFCLSISLLAQDTFSSIAYDKNGKIIYKEKHSVEKENGFIKKVTTDYFNSEDKKIAQLTSSFNGNLFLPDSYFKDLRSNYTEETKLEGEQYIVKTRVEGSKVKTTKIKIKSNMVSGQGFHNFVLKNYELLGSGKKVEINFIIPSMRDYFGFEISSMPNEKPGQSIFRLEISNWLLSLIASEIKVTYEDTTKNLIIFNGLSNVKDDKGDQYNANIIYQY